MTLTDRLRRATCLLDDGPDRPAVILLSCTWNDDALKWLALEAPPFMGAFQADLPGNPGPGTSSTSSGRSSWTEPVLRRTPHLRTDICLLLHTCWW